MRPSNTLGAIDVRWSAWVRTDSHVEDSVGNQTVEEGDDVAGARLDDAEHWGATNCRLMAPAVRRRLAGHGLVRLDVEQVSAAAVGDDLDTRVREQHPDSDGNLSGTPR